MLLFKASDVISLNFWNTENIDLVFDLQLLINFNIRTSKLRM